MKKSHWNDSNFLIITQREHLDWTKPSHASSERLLGSLGYWILELGYLYLPTKFTQNTKIWVGAQTMHEMVNSTHVFSVCIWEIVVVIVWAKFFSYLLGYHNIWMYIKDDKTYRNLICIVIIMSSLLKIITRNRFFYMYIMEREWIGLNIRPKYNKILILVSPIFL